MQSESRNHFYFHFLILLPKKGLKKCRKGERERERAITILLVKRADFFYFLSSLVSAWNVTLVNVARGKGQEREGRPWTENVTQNIVSEKIAQKRANTFNTNRLPLFFALIMITGKCLLRRRRSVLLLGRHTTAGGGNSNHTTHHYAW